MPHYYTNDNLYSGSEYKFNYTFKGKEFTFIASDAVFSKKRVDFGTNLLINSLEDLSNMKILDLGCGVGVIGILVAKGFENTNVLMSDVNIHALTLANKNIELNHINNASVVESSLYEKINDTFDVIISNPPIRAGKQIVHGVIKEGFSHLNNGGMVYVVIQKKQGAESLKKVMEETFGNVYVINKDNGYMIYKSVKEM